MKGRWLFLGPVAVWLLWASCSTGGLYQLKQMNPAFVHPNKYVALLLPVLNPLPKEHEFWDRQHIESCAVYMPDWDIAYTCYVQRKWCEGEAPWKDSPLSGRHPDIRSKEFHACWVSHQPALGLREWLRFSRLAFRAALGIVPMWAGGGTGKMDAEHGAHWEGRNRWWTEPVTRWIEQGS